MLVGLTQIRVLRRQEIKRQTPELRLDICLCDRRGAGRQGQQVKHQRHGHGVDLPEIPEIGGKTFDDRHIILHGWISGMQLPQAELCAVLTGGGGGIVHDLGR